MSAVRWAGAAAANIGRIGAGSRGFARDFAAPVCCARRPRIEAGNPPLTRHFWSECVNSCPTVQTRSSRSLGSTASAEAPAPLDMGDSEELELKCEEFKETLRDPDNIWIRGTHARKKFKLTRDDLLDLPLIQKESPYEVGGPTFGQYPLQEVVQIALHKHGKEALLRHYIYDSRRKRFSQKPHRKSGKLYGTFEEELDDDAGSGGNSLLRKRYWYNSPSASTTEGRQSVLQGLKTNSVICVAKGGVWFATGSHVMFADWMHSIADVANYSYRLIELKRSAKLRDGAHPYGYAPLRYITADRSFVFLLFVGGVCPLISGLSELIGAHGKVPLGEHLLAPAVVFLISAGLEGVAVSTAYHEILSLSEKEGASADSQTKAELCELRSTFFGRLRLVWRYLREGRDVMSTATFTEASSGVLGAGVGLCGLASSLIYQSGTPDVAASMVMASMICGLGTFLLRKSGTALLGNTLPDARVEDLVSLIEAHAAVVSVYDVKTELIGTDTVRFKAEVQFNPQTITERILDVGGNLEDAADCSSKGIPPHALDARRVLAEQMQNTLPHLQHSAPKTGEPNTERDAWLFRNNSLFYEALAWELKDVERVLRHELLDFRHVHIDLEPW